MEKLITEYKNKIKKELQKELGLKSIYMAPDIEKVSVNIGFGKFKDNKEYAAEVANDLATITGQAPFKRIATKSISNFKLRQGETIGYTVTLRGIKAWDFLEKVIKVVLPSVRDFRGISRKSFDGKGNFSFGIKEHFVFPEINSDKVKYIKSLQINIKTTVKDNEQAEKMLDKLGFPFRNKK